MWDIAYPILIHFGISQIISYLALFLLSRAGYETSDYMKYVAALTGLTGLTAALPLLFFYRRDAKNRKVGGVIPSGKMTRLTVGAGMEFLVTGAMLGVAGNLVMAALTSWIPFGSGYENTMNAVTQGQSVWKLVLWIGGVAPFAEEVIFRWLIYLRLRDHMRMITAVLLSALLFGVYHLNLVQGIYAFYMGILFALMLEWTGNLWTSVLLHIGANSWGLLVEELYTGSQEQVLLLMIVQLAALIYTCFRIRKRKRDYHQRKNLRLV